LDRTKVLVHSKPSKNNGKPAKTTTQFLWVTNLAQLQPTYSIAEKRTSPHLAASFPILLKQSLILHKAFWYKDLR